MRRLLLAAALLLGGAGARSGHDDASPPVRAMQDDDTANPAFLWVQQGEALWAAPAGPEGRSCAGCHGAPGSLRGAAARYPAYDARTARPITLTDRVNRCRTEHQGVPALPPEDDTMLSLTALVGLQSRGLPVQVDGGGPAAPALAQGQALFNARMGQLGLSCADCHDRLAGQRLGGARIPEGRANAYPIYRLEWQGVGGAMRRLRNCMTGVRSEPFAPDSPDLAALRLYLGWRSNGLSVETPGVRP